MMITNETREAYGRRPMFRPDLQDRPTPTGADMGDLLEAVGPLRSFLSTRLLNLNGSPEP
jgi:hypothetical protein